MIHLLFPKVTALEFTFDGDNMNQTGNNTFSFNKNKMKPIRDEQNQIQPHEKTEIIIDQPLKTRVAENAHPMKVKLKPVKTDQECNAINIDKIKSIINNQE